MRKRLNIDTLAVCMLSSGLIGLSASQANADTLYVTYYGNLSAGNNFVYVTNTFQGGGEYLGYPVVGTPVEADFIIDTGTPGAISGSGYVESFILGHDAASPVTQGILRYRIANPSTSTPIVFSTGDNTEYNDTPTSSSGYGAVARTTPGYAGLASYEAEATNVATGTFAYCSAHNVYTGACYSNDGIYNVYEKGSIIANVSSAIDDFTQTANLTAGFDYVLGPNDTGTGTAQFVDSYSFSDPAHRSEVMSTNATFTISEIKVQDLSVSTGPGTFSRPLPMNLFPGVPEPGTWALLTAGVFGVGASLRSRRRPGPIAARRREACV